MKANSLLCALLLGSIMPMLAQNQTINSDDLAKRIATSIANVKAGEVVLIQGGKDQIELMEALGEQIHKKGAFPTLSLVTERVTKALYTSIPEEHFSSHHQAEHKLHSRIDLAIILPDGIDYQAIEAQAPKEYNDKHNELMKEEHANGKIEENPQVKFVFVNLPLKKDAEDSGLDLATYEKMINEATAADYTAIAAKGKKLAELFKNGKIVKITTANGTNFSFDLAGRSPIVNDGVISDEDMKSSVKADKAVTLPTGSIHITGKETSASGKVFMARDKVSDKGNKVKVINASFDFVNGKLQNYKAEKNQSALADKLKEADPMLTQFGGISIGLNPAVKVFSNENQDFRPMEAEGHVYVLIGGNEFFGGTNKLMDAVTFPIEKATVAIDGKTIVKDGKLLDIIDTKTVSTSK
ncbi:aminopeptidase [Rhodocytophaga aerolata]|uniref:Aminopeptidase n=1 Tax=Rhodocytophaga aerolata TaxID=455078 RepID=A0ABT8RI19_9BACT|nr:aminopeptidase [Rhodocytophaga aerolata]MDO1451730.1 aminopeptidase [Rhodocytophaga aerolata]